LFLFYIKIGMLKQLGAPHVGAPKTSAGALPQRLYRYKAAAGSAPHSRQLILGRQFTENILICKVQIWADAFQGSAAMPSAGLQLCANLKCTRLGILPGGGCAQVVTIRRL
jgi:hypothetical protein